MEILERLSEELGIKLSQIEAAVNLLDEGNTIPFIARYRKELHGAMDDTILRTLLRTSAERVIFPIQDILGYGADTRMNTPGVAVGNWAYRVTADQLDGIDRGYWKWLNRLYGR